ncbi:MAG: AmmeMemoRadiSam system radical SAM enzyme [Bacteroidales bacterium]|nr:AmmeMemoRadiSam system radical SAM enzyme [Bacteroidales bacterium]
MFYTVTPRGVECGLCPNECTLRPGETGDCRSRVNHADKIYSIGYGNPCAVHIDPIEKKPLLHFHPKSKAYSIAVAGCNFVCLNCQNWQISQTSPKDTRNYDLMPGKLVQEVIKSDCLSIAYTYSEPITYYEYVYESSRQAHQLGLKNVFVSNGYINEEPLRKLAPHLDAANIDLKSFSDDIYLRLSGGKLQPVLNTLKILKEEGVWLEITNLIVPSWTDNPDMIKRMCDWLAANGFRDTPLHFSRFHPAYKLTQLPETSLSTLIKARDIAKKAGLHYCYVGNVPGKGFEDTMCPSCGKKVVGRKGFTIEEYHLEKGSCEFCGEKISGVWE